MRNVSVALGTVILVLACATSGFGQAAATRPQTTGSATIPRTTDGKPDLSGVWEVLNTAAWDIQAHSADTGTPAGLGVVEGNEIPYLPSMLSKKMDNFAHRKTEDSDANCYLPGVPRITYMPYPFLIVQSPQYVTMVYEYIHNARVIPADNSPHPAEANPSWMGDSRGHWDNDTFVVDVKNFNDKTWFDRAGNFHSEALHVVERYSFIDKDHLDYEVTIEDPQVFTRPWKMRMPIYRRIEKDVRPLEYDCYAFQHLFQLPEAK